MEFGKANIILITTDTQRTDTLRCMGSSFAYSPNLDRLAEEGVLFERAYTSSPACMPARCSMISGLYPPLHGCMENGINRREDIPVFTDRLQELGYRTIMVGKTHFGHVPDSFEIREITGGEKGQVRNDDFSRLFLKAGYPENSGWPNRTPEKYCLDSMIVDRALYHMEEAMNGEAPFFLFCSLLSPHSPLDPPGRWDGFYDPDKIPKPRFRQGEWEELPESLKKLCGLPRKSRGAGWTDRMEEAVGNIADDNDEKEMQRYKALYYDSAAYCDALVGRIISFLNRKGLREKTLVIFTSDHGQQYYDHGFNDKHNFYEESSRIPLILSMPSVLPQGKRCAFAGTVDIAPTIVGAAGGSYPEGNGYDLFTPLRHGREPERNCAVSVIQRSMALVTHRYKLEYYQDDRMVRLFDLEKDEEELINCAEEKDCREIRERLLKILLLWRCELTDVHDIRRRLGQGGAVAARAAERWKTLPGNTCDRLAHDMVRELIPESF